MRRAGISLQVRIRSSDFNDGNFDEVRMTQSASRKAIYFFTELNRYYKGMRVRVTSPYNPKEGAVNLEQIGEVARVHKRADGYGVAVLLLTSAQPSATSCVESSATVSPANPWAGRETRTSPTERRCATRSPFVAPLEMVEMQTGSRIRARTSDLSPQGCYVDTLNPLAVGAAVRLQIHRGGLILDVLANVTSRHIGSGMGLEFGETTEAQKAVLESWLGELRFAPLGVFDKTLPAANPARRASGDCMLRLVHVLLRKGVLTQCEAREILGDSEASAALRLELQDLDL
jgi:PilZ domain